MATRLRQSPPISRAARDCNAVALAPQCDSLDQEIMDAPLSPGGSEFTVRGLDTTPARETLMISIMRNATAPVGCVPDLKRFKH
jgi:hypothetical protein